MKKLDEKTAEIFEKVMGYVETAEGFAVEQAPLLVQEIYSYYLFYHVFWLVFLTVTIALFSVSFQCGRRYHKRIIASGRTLEQTTEDEYALIIAPQVCGIVGMVFSAVPVLINTIQIAKLWLAPRLYLLEYLKGLL